MFIDLQPNVFLFDRLKTQGLHSNGIYRNRQQRHEIMSRFVGFRFAHHTRALCCDSHCCPCNDRSRVVRNCPGKAAICLAVEEWVDGKDKRAEKHHEKCPLVQHTCPFFLRSQARAMKGLSVTPLNPTKSKSLGAP